MNTSNHLIDLGNCSSIINWNEIILDIEDRTDFYVGPRQSLDDPEIKEIADKWKIGNYKSFRSGGTAEWHMFFPGVHFDKKILDLFLEFCNIEKCNSAWISRILPGHCAPIHRDLQVAGTTNPIRIHCHIDTPEVGHVLIVADEYIFNQQQGQIYQWNDPLEWHSSFNLGLKPSYLFNIY
jgi:hypothetical protein